MSLDDAKVGILELQQRKHVPTGQVAFVRLGT